QKFIDECPGDLPSRVSIDFTRLTFIKPIGVTFLSNFVDWLTSRNVEVTFDGTRTTTAAISYLDDSLFFEKFLGRKLNRLSRPRATTLPLVSVSHSSSHDWLRHEMIPWLSKALSVSSASLHPFQNCIAEVFNNTKDHSTLDVDSIFVQHFPNKKEVCISIAD